jgi:hypothetical protein
MRNPKVKLKSLILVKNWATKRPGRWIWMWSKEIKLAKFQTRKSWTTQLRRTYHPRLKCRDRRKKDEHREGIWSNGASRSYGTWKMALENSQLNSCRMIIFWTQWKDRKPKRIVWNIEIFYEVYCYNDSRNQRDFERIILNMKPTFHHNLYLAPSTQLTVYKIG